MSYNHQVIGDTAFIECLRVELEKARLKFPNSTYGLAALVEEVGELSNALLKRAAGVGPNSDVIDEAIQVAAMALRIAVEGDESMETPLGYRDQKYEERT